MPKTKNMKYTASRLSEGNTLFPPVIETETEGLYVTIPGFFKNKKTFIAYSEISSFEIDSPFIGFATITFMASNVKVKVHGLSSSDARSIERTIKDGKSGKLARMEKIKTDREMRREEYRSRRKRDKSDDEEPPKTSSKKKTSSKTKSSSKVKASKLQSDVFNEGDTSYSENEINNNEKDSSNKKNNEYNEENNKFTEKTKDNNEDEIKYDFDTEKEKIDLKFYNKQKEFEFENQKKQQKIDNAKKELETGGNKAIYYAKMFWISLDKPWKKIALSFVLLLIIWLVSDFATQSSDRKKMLETNSAVLELYTKAKTEIQNKNIEKAQLILEELNSTINSTSISNEFLSEELSNLKKDWNSKKKEIKDEIAQINSDKPNTKRKRNSN